MGHLDDQIAEINTLTEQAERAFGTAEVARTYETALKRLRAEQLTGDDIEVTPFMAKFAPLLIEELRRLLIAH